MTKRYIVNMNAPFWRICRFLKKALPYILIGLLAFGFLKFAKYAFITGIDNELARRDAVTKEHLELMELEYER